MKKNFIERHILFFSLIVVCFVIVPFVRDSYAMEHREEAPLIKISAAPEALEKPVHIKKQSVALDAGHGGYDDGSVANDGTKEKTIALQITKRIGQKLEAAGIPVVYTRTSDTVSWPKDNVEDLLKRSAIVNQAKADYFVSIHTNFADETSAKGSEIWVQRSDKKQLAFAQSIHKQLHKLKGMASRGIKDEEEAPLSLLHFNHMPSVLVETGFLSNAQDKAYLKSEKGQEAMAQAIAQGILAHLKEQA